MNSRTIIMAALLAVALLTPTASAAAVEGNLTSPGAAYLAGEVTLEAREGTFIDLAPALAHAPLVFAGDAGTLITVSTSRDYAVAGDGAWTPGPDSRETTAVDAATWTIRSCVEPCFALLIPIEAAALMTASADGALAPRAAAADYHVGFPSQSDDASFYQAVPAGSYEFGPAPSASTPTGPATLAVTGAAQLVFWNVTLETANGERTSGQSTSPNGPAGSGSRVTATYHVLQVPITTMPAEPLALRWFDAEPMLSLAGTFTLEEASGTVVVDGTTHVVDAQRVELAGEHLTVSPTAPDAQPLGASAGHAFRLGGQADSVIIGDAAVAATPVVAIAVGTTIAAFLALLGGYALYTRIDRSNIFDNPNRKAVYEAIQGGGAPNVSDIIRHTGLAEAVVRHHLHMLTGAKMIMSHGSGRQRAFFLSEAKPRDTVANNLVALRDDTRRKVAQALVAKGTALSQKGLCQETGLSQRLVSYHLQRLRKEGLIDFEGTMPRRYRATPELASCLDEVAAA